MARGTGHDLANRIIFARRGCPKGTRKQTFVSAVSMSLKCHQQTRTFTWSIFKRNGKSVSVEPTLLKISDGLSLRYGKSDNRASRPPPHNPHPARVFPSAGAVKPKSAANADLRYEHAKKRGPLTALLSAYNLFGDSLFEASCCLGGKSTGRCL